MVWILSLDLMQKTLIYLLGFSQVAICAKKSWELWDYQVYTGREFNDFTIPTTERNFYTKSAALLILYTPSCDQNMYKDELIDVKLPPAQYFVLARHDYETFPKYIWYELDAQDDLQARYRPRQCPDYLFFEQGMHLYAEPLRYSKKSNLSALQWVWDQILIEFQVMNSRAENLIIEFDGKGPSLSKITIASNTKMNIKAYLSFFITIIDSETQRLFFAEEIDENYQGKLITIYQDLEMDGTKDAWIERKKKEQHRKHAAIRGWRGRINDAYLHIFKQPVVVPKFTDLGYKKGTIPKELYKDLLKFYTSNMVNRTDEIERVEPAINDREVKCTMVYLSDEIINHTAVTMKPYLEEWSNVTLRHTYMYGIREYYRGNKLRHHVDRIHTHVVSVILQIAQDIDNEPDWELEIIGFNGKRKNVTLLPGEMLFYESATLVHGRPYPFQGKIFANAFLHYQPVYGWHWDIAKSEPYIINNNEKVENTAMFNTETMLNRKISMEKFVEKKELHDEL